MLKLLKYLSKRDWCFALLSIALIVGQVWLDLRMPEYMTRITTLVQTEGSRMSEILAAGGWMLLCALGSLVGAILVGYLVSVISASYSMRLREAVYDRVMSFSTREIHRFSTASLITRSGNDISQVQMLVSMGLQMLVKAPITGIMALVKISGKSWQWTALTGAAIGVMLVFAVFVILYALPRFKKIQKQTDELNRVTREHLGGLPVVRAYNAEAYQEEKFDTANRILTRTNLQANLAMVGISPVMNLSMNGLSLGIYWIGAYLLNAVALGGMEGMAARLTIFSDMVVFMSYAMQVVSAFLMLVMIFVMFPRAMVSARRILEVLQTESSIIEGSRSSGEPGQSGMVEFVDVSFRYPDAVEDALQHVSFKVEQGQMLAIIGATGSSKSTLLNLIPRFYDVTAGKVLLDGVDVREYTQLALHSRIGYVPQKAYLFTGTVEGNVAYGCEEAVTETVERALEIAQAADFIRDGVGLQGQVAQGGSNFSGGQKQRLSIARAVAVQPEILLFDDSFSALDFKTDRALRQALKQRTAGVTTIIVAQRIGTIRDADQILVLDEGKVVGLGTHAELMRSCAVYQEIARSQLSEEELAS